MFSAFRTRRSQDDQPRRRRIKIPTVNELRRLFAFLAPYKGRMAIAVAALVFSTGLGLVFPWFMQNLVDAVLKQRDLVQLNRITLFLLGTFLLRAIFTYFQYYTLAYIGERIVTDLRKRTYNQLNRLGLGFFAERRVGELVSRLASDVTQVRAVLTNAVAQVLTQVLTFAGSLALMLVLNWRLTLFILVLAPLLILSAWYFGRRLRGLSTQAQDQLAESHALAEEALSGVRVVKAFTREPFETARYGDQVEQTFRTMMRMTALRAAFGPLLTFMTFAALAAILWFGGREVLAERLTGGSLVAFLIYGLNIASAMGSFANLYSQVQEALGASRRIFELLDEQPEIADAPDAVVLPPVHGYIRFEGVSFAYASSAVHVLKDINLEIQPGEVLALVGPSGAGKSTLFNLIPRFYDPKAGRVSVDGHDLRGVTIASLRGQIGLVPQETHLFSGSVRENLRYGRLEASDDELEEAARAANAAEFIERLPEGYDTLVGERGVKLSGGERQRIAIGRALLKDPRILLLDEATSSLDSESEGLVQEALERLLRGRTTVIIAHRLSTVHMANRIAVLNQGRLVEMGNHAELLALDGLYARLYRLQFEPNP